MLITPLRAIVDMSIYREAVRKSGGWIAGYVAYLGLLFAVCGTIALYLRVSPLIQETVDWAAASVPALTFGQGKVTSPAAGLVRVQHPRLPQLVILIDTTREAPVTLEELAGQKAVAFLTSNALYLTPNPNKLEAYPLDKLKTDKPVVVDQAFYRAVGEALPKVLYPLSFVTTGAVFFGWKLAAALVYSLLALLLNAMLSGGLEYPQLFKLAVFAQTPVVLLQMAQMFLPSPIPLFGLIALLVVGVYLWQGIRQNAAAPAAGPA